MSTDANRGKWYGPWCAYFTQLLEERGMNPTDFAALVGDRQNNIWQYERGVIRPPLRKLDKWTKRLNLSDEQAEKFIGLGRAAHAPPEIRRELEVLRATIDALRERLRPKGKRG